MCAICRSFSATVRRFRTTLGHVVLLCQDCTPEQ